MTTPGAYLAICAIVRNEAPYIREWLSYHYAAGVERFVIFHNASTDATLETIRAWPNAHLVTLIDWPERDRPQIGAYETMLRAHRGVAEWCAFIDVDEFLCPKGPRSVPDILRDLPAACGALYVHWMFFGSSGLETRPDGPVTEAFIRRAHAGFGPNRIGKTILRLATATRVINPHMIGTSGQFLNDAGEAIDQGGDGSQARPSHARLALHHYFTKTLGEWQVRRAGGRPSLPRDHADSVRPLAQFHAHDRNEVADDDAARLFQYARALLYRDDPVPAPEARFRRDALAFQPWLQRLPDDLAEQRERQALLAERAGARFGEGAFVAEGARVFTQALELGARSWIAAGAVLRGQVTIGPDCSVNSYAHIVGTVRIGANCRIASMAAIYGFNHGIARTDQPIKDQKVTSRGVVLHEDVWVGANAVIVDGVEIGAHCVVAAGAVVTRGFPPWQVIAGNPARAIRDRRERPRSAE